MQTSRVFTLLGTGLLVMQLRAAGTPQSEASSSSQAPAAANSEILKELRERIAKQEEQIKRLQQAVDEQRTMLDKALAASEPTAGSQTATAADRSANEPVSIVPALNVARPHGLVPARAGQNLQSSNPSPLGIRIGSTTFTPLGFVDFTWFGRSTNVGSGLGTNFGAIPFNNSTAAHLSENNLSTQNSRIGFRVDSEVRGAKVLGYFEADFLGNQPANVFVTSNADTFRMRNVFVDIQKGRWEILGGQDWSMFTPNRKGLSPIPGDIFYTQNMDTNYQAGLIWARQSQFRLVFHPNKNWNLGLSIENPQQYIGGSGGLNGAAITLPAAPNIAAMASQFNNGAVAIGNVTGAQNFATPNLHPDLIFKGAYDGHAGDKLMHVEAGALVRSFKGVYATTTTPVAYKTSTTTAVSGEVNVNLQVATNFRIIANTFFGEGGGRYVFGLAPDVIIRPDGSISPIHTYSTVDGFEVNATRNTLISAYYGGVYVARQSAIDTNGRAIGYGFAGSSNNDNRTIQEFTFGLTQTFWKSQHYGAISLINQYSYLTRNPWAVASGAPKAAHTNMYWVDLRYTLP
jgi:hypothetical protein